MTQPVIITCNGTGDPNPADTVGFSGQLGSLVGGVNPWEIVADQIAGTEVPAPPYIWQPIGYPANVTNMEASYTNAVEQIVAALGGPASSSYQAPVYPSGPFVLSGYSQGSCATNTVWSQYIYPEDGILHNRIDDCVAIVNFGDVFRCAGYAAGNVYQGIPLPAEKDGTVTGGIAQSTGAAPLNLTVEETTYVNPNNPLGLPVIMSYALAGDLYGASPQGAAGIVGKSIMEVIFTTDFVNIVEVLADLAHPIGIFEEAANAIGFFSAAGQIGVGGYPEAAHWQYANAGCVASAAQYLRALAAAL
jgi:hypothetical protein